MLIMKNSLWPLVQLNTMPGLFDWPAQKGRKELPDDKEEKIIEMMILRPDSKELYQWPDFSPTRLLVATLSYYVHKHFMQGMTMAELQRKYIVWSKPLALCIIGRKYQGGTDRKAQVRKKTQEYRWQERQRRTSRHNRTINMSQMTATNMLDISIIFLQHLHHHHGWWWWYQPVGVLTTP